MSEAKVSRRIWCRGKTASVALLGAPLLGALGGLLVAGSAYADDPISPDGIWYTKDQESIIRVHPCADDATNHCGTLVWLKEPTEKDGTAKADNVNPDPDKKGKPMIGLDILLGMKADDDHWTGKAYNPDDGKMYSITFHVKTDKEDNDSADLRGCILGFLCQTETFVRAKDVPGGDPTVTADQGTPSTTTPPMAGTKKHKKPAKKEDAAH